MRERVQSVLVYGLVVLAVAQMGWLGLRTRGASAPPEKLPQPVVLGDTLEALALIDATGAPLDVSLVTDDGKPTVVMAFWSDCAHCQTVASNWATWYPAVAEQAHIVGITRDEVSVAQAYRSEHAWGFPVFSLQDPETPAAETFITSRTPWIFVYAGDGSLQLMVHGASVDDVSGMIATLGATEAVQ